MFKECLDFFQENGYELFNNDGYQQDLVNGNDVITVMKIEENIVSNKYKYLENGKYKFISETLINNEQDLYNVLNG